MILIVIGLCSDLMFAVGSGKIARWSSGDSGFLAAQRWILSLVFAALAGRLLTLERAA